MSALQEIDGLADMEVLHEITTQDELTWVNVMIESLWPRITEAVKKVALEDVQRMIQAQVPSALQDIGFTEFDLGEVVPTIGPIKVYSSQTGLKIRLKLNFDTQCVITLNALVVSLGIEKLSFSGTFYVHLSHLLNELPIVGAISVYAIDPPNLSLDFNGVLKVADWPVVRSIIRKSMQKAINQSLVLPNRLTLTLGTEAQGVDQAAVYAPAPVGCLEIRIRGENLDCEDWRPLGKDSSDPYVILKLGDTVFQSSTIRKDLNPVWEDPFYFFVFDKDQDLRVEFYDHDPHSPDDFIGSASSPGVVDLLDSQEEVLELLDKNGGVSGTAVIQARWLEALETSVVSVEDHEFLMVRLKVDAVRMNPVVSDDVKLEIRLGGSTAETRLGVLPDQTVLDTNLGLEHQRLIHKLHQKGFDSQGISELLDIQDENDMVNRVLHGKPFKGEGLGHRDVSLSIEDARHFRLTDEHTCELTLRNARGTPLSNTVVHPLFVDPTQVQENLEVIKFEAIRGSEYLLEMDLTVSIFPLEAV